VTSRPFCNRKLDVQHLTIRLTFYRIYAILSLFPEGTKKRRMPHEVHQHHRHRLLRARRPLQPRQPVPDRVGHGLGAGCPHAHESWL